MKRGRGGDGDDDSCSGYSFWLTTALMICSIINIFDFVGGRVCLPMGSDFFAVLSVAIGGVDGGITPLFSSLLLLPLLQRRCRCCSCVLVLVVVVAGRQRLRLLIIGNCVATGFIILPRR